MEEKKIRKFSEKVKEGIQAHTKTIPVTFPLQVYDKFDKFATENSASCYWLAVIQLLDYYDKQEGENIAILLMYEKMQSLENQFAEVVMKFDEADKVPERKTFGRKEEKNEK